MRVLLNTYATAFACPGGGEIQLLESAEALRRRGVEIVFHDPWHPRFDEVDVVHQFSVLGGSYDFCKFARRLGLPVVLSSILWVDESTRQVPWLDRIIAALASCDLILTNSRTESQLIAEFFELDPARFLVTHNAVDERFGRRVGGELFGNRFDLPPGEPFLLNVANVEPRKNQVRLAEVARRLGLPLVVLGNVRSQEYEAECRERAGGLWRYCGYVEHGGELLRSAYAACAAFVLPSLVETPGLAALEAAAAGARVVVTEVGSTREYFGDRVAYVDPLDSDSIADAIERQLRAEPDPGLPGHVLANFTWDRTAAQLIEAYERAIASADRREAPP